METQGQRVWLRSTSQDSQDQEMDKIPVVDDAISKSQSSSVSDQFDLDCSRNQQKNMTQKSGASSTLSVQPISLNQQKTGEYFGARNTINILGFELQLQILEERHKDPILLLKTIAFFYLCGSLCYLGTFIFGSRYDLVLSIISPLHTVFCIFFVLKQLQQSVKDGIKIRRIDLPYIIFLVSGYTTVIVYSFLVKTPFNSMPIFLLALFTVGFFFLTVIALACTKTNMPASDPHYEMKFFVKRVMVGILNCTSAMDVLSDIALGIQIIIKYHGFLRYIGIVLFLCCVLDFVIVNIRILMPEKVSIQMHAWAIVLEVLIIVTTILVAVKIKTQNADWEFILLLVFSFVSTMINFLHHIFIVVEWKWAIMRKRQVVTFVEIFE
eukprot:TRINITY_DN11342_c0_g1_i1.p1 TRINITY_DN11342_c0_g1~~TRINITY_DN11342_c0_g1_i1.p1  ORF type:complete len:381 (-),score=12.73 TRINITY_DN11342_c0_g1_i1:79-1221(-)